MTSTNTTPDAGAAAAASADKPAMTASQAAKRVRRPVTTMVPAGEDEQGKPKFKPVTKQVAVDVDEVLTFKDYGSHVVVVTKDGQKFSSADEA